ncbi:unnamed protein product [Lota lota]
MRLSSALCFGVYLLLSQVSQPRDPKEAFRPVLDPADMSQDLSPCWVPEAFHVTLFMRDEFDKLRPLCYTNADVFLLCFSVTGAGPRVPSESRKHPSRNLSYVGRLSNFLSTLGVGDNTQCALWPCVTNKPRLTKARPDGAAVGLERGGETGLSCLKLSRGNRPDTPALPLGGGVQKRKTTPFLFRAEPEPQSREPARMHGWKKKKRKESTSRTFPPT